MNIHCIKLLTILSSFTNISPLFPCFLTQGTSHGGFLHPGAEDKSLSKTQLELTINTLVWCHAASMDGAKEYCPGKADKTSKSEYRRSKVLGIWSENGDNTVPFLFLIYSDGSDKHVPLQSN